MLILGWGGLLFLFLAVKPTVWGRWSFYVLWVMALTGTALPAIYFFHRLSQPASRVQPRIILRQALWVGVFGATLAWLQLSRILNLWVVVGLAVGLTAIEYFTRLREKSQWHPPEVIRRTPPESGDDKLP